MFKHLPYSVTSSKQLFLIAAVLAPPLAFAHTNTNLITGFQGGFCHPFTGLDHTLAMLSVGLLASQKKGRSQYATPLAFLLFMSIGGLLGLKSIHLPFAEMGITLSVLCLGLILTSPSFVPNLILYFLIAAFALCHGHAHGIEIQSNFSGYEYAGGFLTATALLHAIGFTFGFSLKHTAHRVLPIAGMGIALCTLWI